MERGLLKRGSLAIIFLIAPVVIGHSHVLRIGVTTSQNWALWQTSPPVFTESNTWAGLTASLALGWFSVSAGTSVADLQTLKPTVPPFFSIRGRLAPAIFGLVNPYVGIGTVFTPARRGHVLSFSIGILAKPFPNTEVTTELIRATLVGASVEGTVIGCGISLTVYFLSF